MSTTVQKKRSCHHCRKGHIKCDGYRPCSSCISRKKDCIEYDVKLTRATNKKSANSPFGVFSIPLDDINAHAIHGNNSGASGTSTSNINTTNDDINSLEAEQLREELKKAKIQIETLQREKQQLLIDYVKLSASDTSGTASAAPLVKLRPTNEFALDLWDPPTTLKRPIVVWNASTMELIGCNSLYRQLVGYNRAQLERVNMFALMPEKLKDSCRYLMPMIMRSPIKVFVCAAVIKCRRGYILIRNENHFEKSFVWTNMEVLDHWDDAWVVDDIAQPATVNVAYNEDLIRDIINGRMIYGLHNAFALIMLRNSKKDSIADQNPSSNVAVYSQTPSNTLSQDTIGATSSIETDNTLNLQGLTSEQQYSMQEDQLLAILPELLGLVTAEQSQSMIPSDVNNNNQSRIYQPQLLPQQIYPQMNIQQQVFSMPGTNIIQDNIPAYQPQQPPSGTYPQNNMAPNFHEHQLQ